MNGIVKTAKKEGIRNILTHACMCDIDYIVYEGVCKRYLETLLDLLECIQNK